MEVFSGWTTLDETPIMTSTSDDDFAYPGHQQHFDDAVGETEWTGFFRALDRKSTADDGNLECCDVKLSTHAAASTMTSVASLSLISPQSTSSSGSSNPSPPQFTTYPVSTWPATSTPVSAYPPGFPHYGDWNLEQAAPLLNDNNFGYHGLGIHLPTPSHSAGLYTPPNHFYRPESPHTGMNVIKRDYDEVWSRDEINGPGDDEELDAADPCYAQLLYRCLKEAPNHTMSLKDLYQWVSQNSQKAKDPKTRGWQNSVRHNLSMNAAFERVHANSAQGGKKGSLWRLTDKALREGVISTTRYRKDPKRRSDRRGLPALQRQLSGAKGGQATRAASRRNRDIRHAKSTTYLSALERYHQPDRRYNGGLFSPQSIHSVMTSPQPTMLPHAPTSAGFYETDQGCMFPHMSSNPHTPPQMALRFGEEAKPALLDVELQHLDLATRGLFGIHDDPIPDTPSLATEASYMSDDGMHGLISRDVSREATIF